MIQFVCSSSSYPKVKEENMQFYNLKTRSYVDVPEKDIKKTKMKRKTKSGEQIRYALTASYQGSKLYKFVNKDTFDNTKVEEI